MNYIGDHPLNLLGKVAIVTSAASPTGAAICRELLNCNANVLGVDCVPAHKTTNSHKGSHFQFFRYRNESLPEGRDIVEFAKRVYLRDNVDFLLDVTGERDVGMEAVVGEVVEALRGQGHGLVVMSVLTGDRKEERAAIATAKESFSQLAGTGMSFNIVLPRVAGDVENGDTAIDPSTKIAMHGHIAAHVERREKGGYLVEQERDVANLILFFCTRLGEGLSGLVIGTNGIAMTL